MGRDSRALALETLPCDDIAKHVEAPAFEPSEVDVGRTVVEPKRLTDERLAAGLGRLPEVVQRLRWLRKGRFGRAREVDASKEEMAAGGVWAREARMMMRLFVSLGGRMERPASGDGLSPASDAPRKKAEEECT